MPRLAGLKKKRWWLSAPIPLPAVSEADRRAKAKYLLNVEARGELDLKEHMQAVLRSTMWKA
ncbi:hypothetical protein MES4922_170146 [Mesorhizobium ventifaucium]|uniref:Uncharacterized protein n=1 Tax=Mesorhizobium ventifaucium TaxID=666020 RepID=A0ABM9DJI1_9HYPH|nr:hypothetical protein MES4922_170146 [Mesorhizobium ventifaucium]